MKRYTFFLLLLIYTSISLGQTNQELRDYADYFLVAIGTQVPDITGGMASALGTAPEVTKRYISQKCHTQMQSIENELMDNRFSPKRLLELNELYIRAQAMNSAINGNPKPLIDFEKDKAKKMQEREKERQKKLREDEKEHIEMSIELLQEELNKLKALIAKNDQEGIINYNQIKGNLGKAFGILTDDKNIADEINNYENICSVFVAEGNQLCNEATSLQSKIQELYRVLVDDEAIMNEKINQAIATTANCTSPADNNFVKTSYQEAVAVFATSENAREEAFNYYVDINIRFKQINTINKSLDSLYNYIDLYLLLNKDNDRYNKLNSLLKPMPKQLEQLEFGMEEAKNFPDKIQKLEKNIEDARAAYDLTTFSEYEAKFNQLINDAGLLQPSPYVVNLATLSDLYDEHNKYELNASYLSNDRHREKTINRHAISCFPIESTEIELDRIEEVLFGERLLLKTNERLRKGCVPVPTPTTQNDSTTKPATANNPPPPKPTTNTNTTQKPEKSTFGGLAIGGPSQITVGKGTQFIALDAAGDPYSNTGDFHWMSSREDLMFMSNSGNALGLKSGYATIILKYDGVTKYKDVEIIENDNIAENTFSNNEDSNGGDSNNNSHKEKCDELIALISIYLNIPDINLARSTANKAVAYGCNLNIGELNNAIAQIEKQKKEEQERWEREYAAQAAERQREDERKRRERNQNLNNFVNLLGEQLASTMSDQNQDHGQVRNNSDKTNNSNNLPWDNEKLQEQLDAIGEMDPNKQAFVAPFEVRNTKGSNNAYSLEETSVVSHPSTPVNSIDCIRKFCPICPEEKIVLLNVEAEGTDVRIQCNACKEKYRVQIEDCQNGGSSANSQDRQLSEFDTYSVYKCTVTTREYEPDYTLIITETFYDLTGPEHKGRKKEGECSTVFRGNYMQCLSKSRELNKKYGKRETKRIPK